MSHRRGAGAWLAVAAASISVGPGVTYQVPFTVRVPTDAVPGDHLAGVAVEQAQPTQPEPGSGAREVLREVVGVLIDVSGPARPFSLLISGIGVCSATMSGRPEILIRLGDTGQLLGQPPLVVDVSGPRGYRRSERRQLQTLLPGDTIHYPVVWPEPLAAGSYRMCAYDPSEGMPEECLSVSLGTRVGSAPASTSGSSEPLPALWWVLLAVALAVGVAAGAVTTRLLGRRR